MECEDNFIVARIDVFLSALNTLDKQSNEHSFVLPDGTSESGQVLNDADDITSLFPSLHSNVNNGDFLMPNGNGRISSDRIFPAKKSFGAAIYRLIVPLFINFDQQSENRLFNLNSPLLFSPSVIHCRLVT